MKPLNITFFGFAPLTYGGGYEIYIMEIIQNLLKSGHNINVITGNQSINDIESVIVFQKLLEKRIPKDEINKKFNHVRFYQYGLTSFIPSSQSYNRLRRVIKKSDIIYTRNEIIDFLSIQYFSGKKTPPIVCGIHTSIYYPFRKSFVSKLHNFIYKKSWYGKLLNRSSIIITQNYFDTRLISTKYNIDKSKIIRLLPFVNTSFFLPHKSENHEGLRVLFVGRLTEQKGIDILSKSIEKLSVDPIFNKITFTIIGSGELEYLIKRLAKKYSNVRFLGFMDIDKLVELYNSHDVVILPSRWETALKVVLEAQSCGLPVIVSNIPGPNELIIPEKTGFLIRPASSNDLTNKLLRMYNIKQNKHLFLIMKKLARKNAEKFSAESVIKKIEDLFFRLSSGINES